MAPILDGGRRPAWLGAPVLAEGQPTRLAVLPVVATPIREAATSTCVLTARTVDDWSHAIDEALVLRQDADYRAALLREARAHDWSVKAGTILTALKQFDART